MYWRAAAVVAAVLAGGCLGPRAKFCERTGVYCPPDLACAPEPILCGEDPLVEACLGKMAFDPCAFSETDPGACVTGVCTKCTRDLAGCSFDGWSPMASPETIDLRAIHVFDIDDAYAVGTMPMGTKGYLLHYNGERWQTKSTVDVVTGVALTSLWGTDANNIFVAAGSRLLRFDGQNWTDAATPARALVAMWGSGSRAIAVGLFGTYALFDGSSWTVDLQMPSVAQALNAVWGRSANDVLVAGNAGLIHHFDGSIWTSSRPAKTSPPADPDLVGIWGIATGDVFAVGLVRPSDQEPNIFRFSSSWMREALPGKAPVSLNAVWAFEGDTFTVGKNGKILHHTGSEWVEMPSSSPELFALSGTSLTNVIAVGASGTILRYTGRPN